MSKETKEKRVKIEFYIGAWCGESDIIYLPINYTFRQIQNRFLKRNPHWGKLYLIIGKVLSKNKGLKS